MSIKMVLGKILLRLPVVHHVVHVQYLAELHVVVRLQVALPVVAVVRPDVEMLVQDVPAAVMLHAALTAYRDVMEVA